MLKIDMTFCELREKEVINISDGKKLGRIIDLALTGCGQILGIVLPSERRLFKQVTSGDSIFVPWKNICRIGDDVILVELLTNANIGMDALPCARG